MMRKIKVTHFLRVIRLRKKHHIYSGNMVATPCQEVPAKAMLFHRNDKHSLRKSSKRQAMINVLLNDFSRRNVGFVHRFARCWSCSRLVTYSILLRLLFAIHRVKFLKMFEFGAQRGEGYRGESALLCSQFQTQF